MGMQAPLINLIDARVDRTSTEIIGTTVTPAYRWYDLVLSRYLWVMDVDLGVDGNRPDANTVVKSVPIADASHGVHKVGPGTKVRLRRGALTRTYEIVGLGSIVHGQVSVIEVTYSTASISIGTPVTFGADYRVLNYDDLGDSANNGGYVYGILPYGTMGKYNAAGDLQYVLVVP